MVLNRDRKFQGNPRSGNFCRKNSEIAGGFRWVNVEWAKVSRSTNSVHAQPDRKSFEYFKHPTRRPNEGDR